jgi:hypothetical protein
LRKTLLLSALFVGLLFLQTASAASDQGLTWGIMEGQTFTFSVDESSETSNFTITTSVEYSFQVIMEISSLPEIRADIDSLSELPPVDVNIKFGNCTDPAALIPLWFSFIMPVGNWALIDEFYQDLFGSMPGIIWIDNASVYGYSMSWDTYGGLYNCTLKYLKSDGFLLSMYVDEEMLFSNFTMNLVRQVGPDAMTVILVGGGVRIIVITVAILKMKKDYIFVIDDEP